MQNIHTHTLWKWRVEFNIWSCLEIKNHWKLWWQRKQDLCISVRNHFVVLISFYYARGKKLMVFFYIISKSATKSCLLETQGYESDLCAKYQISDDVKKSQRHLWQMEGRNINHKLRQIFISAALKFPFFLKEFGFVVDQRLKVNFPFQNCKEQ